MTRALDLPRARRAQGVNALDEVPDSTWFTNRIGVRELSPDEVRRGPTVIGSPEPHKPWTIHSTKVGGVAVGFIITDARGEKFVLKFERPGSPRSRPARTRSSNRILWAAGYNVPEDHVVYLREGDLVRCAGRQDQGRLRQRVPARARRAPAAARAVRPRPRWPAARVASRMLDGAPLGGHPGMGVRPDDPNDRIRHELRRDLRGAYAFFSWLISATSRQTTRSDMYVADPADPAALREALPDRFRQGPGGDGDVLARRRRGQQYVFDAPNLLAVAGDGGPRTARAGAPPRPAAARGRPVRGRDLRSRAPGSRTAPARTCRSRTADAYDKLWAARIISRFTRAQLRAAVDAARFSDPRAAEYVVDTLVARQRATVLHWFKRVSPLTGLELRGASGSASTTS